MMLVAKSNVADKIIGYVNEHGTVSKKELEKLLVGDVDDEGESFYT